MKEDTNQIHEAKFHLLHYSPTKFGNSQIHTFFQSYILVPTCAVHEALILPKLERVLDRSMMALLLGLLRTDLLARDISAVTRVIDIL